MGEIQTYQPYRSKIFNMADVNYFNKLKPIIVVRDTLLSWLIIIISIYIASLFKNNNLILIINSLIIGTQIYSLMIIGHDGLHRRLFNKIWQNDIWNDLFILGSMGAITRINRKNHIQHHSRLSLKSDPDRYKYQTLGRNKKLTFILKLSGLTQLLSSFKNVYLVQNNEINRKKNIYKNRESYSLRDILILIVWQIFLIYSLTNIFGYKGYFLFWIIPLIFASSCDMARVFCEHSSPSDDIIADKSLRLINIKANFFERLLFAPHNMNFHAVHHIWPSIPYYNLKNAAKTLESKVENFESNIKWMPSYTNIIIKFFKYAK